MGNRTDQRAIRSSPLFDAAWYCRTYPDVRLSGIDPARHYLAIGADLGRNPGPGFDTAFYRSQFRQGHRPKLNPLLHYHRYGRAAGRKPVPPSGDGPARQADRGEWLSHCLFGLGLDPGDTARLLRCDAWTDRDAHAEAVLHLAIYHLAEDGPGGAERALAVLGAARPRDRALRSRLAAATLFAASLHAPEIGEAAFALAAAEGLLTPDLLLARAALVPTASLRRLHLAKAQALGGLAAALPAEDRADDPTAIPALPATTAAAGPLLTVLLPVMPREAVPLGTLRALGGQAAGMVQLVLVDAGVSPADVTAEVAALLRRAGGRIVAAPQASSRGAALAAGLAVATGRFVLAWPAAGWLHPEAIARCLDRLLAGGGVAMAVGRSIVVDEGLRPVRIAPDGAMAAPDPELAVVETAVLRDRLGGWDPASPDPAVDLWHRARLRLGEDAVGAVAVGPLLFCREDQPAGPVRHEQCHPRGASRLALALEAARIRHGREADSGAASARAALQGMQPTSGRRDVVYAVDLCGGGEAMIRTVREARAMKRAGLMVALLDLSTADPGRPGVRHLADEAYVQIEAGNLRVLSGEAPVSCQLLVVASPAGLVRLPRHRPRIVASDAVIIADPTALGEGVAGGAVVEHWQTGLERFAGLRGTVSPADAVSASLLADAGVRLDGASPCWQPVVELRAWRGGRRRSGAQALRIGHHDRAGPDGWPATAASIRAAYRPADDLEVRVFGAPDLGLQQGGRPAGWRIVDAAAQTDAEFLRSLDVFVYCPQPTAHPRAVRLIAEAMAAGLPVVTVPAFSAVFGEAAMYATPGEAIAAARRLAGNRAARTALVERADAYLAAVSSPEAHASRLATLGVHAPQPVAR